MDPFVSRLGLSNDAVLTALEAGKSKADEIGVPMSMCVVSGGVVKGFLGMASPGLPDGFARAKAFTAALGYPPTVWADFQRGDLGLADLQQHPDFTTLAGGLPIPDQDGNPTGCAVGVSGGHYSQDILIAEAMVQALGLPVAPAHLPDPSEAGSDGQANNTEPEVVRAHEPG